MSNILITSAGKRVSLVEIFQKELKKFFPRGKVFTVDANPMLSAACTASDKSFLISRLDHPNYINELIEICKSENVKIVIPTIDTELVLLAENNDKLISNGVTPIISSLDFIKKCRNKRKIHLFFKEQSINAAKEYKKNDYPFPLFIKPIDGSRSSENYVINSKADLLKKHFDNDDLMFLEYFNAQEYQEYTCDLYYGKDSELKCVVPRKRIEVRDGEVTKAKTEKNILVKFINEKLKIINGARGCLTAQFFLSRVNNQVIGIEINPRFGGGYPLAYHAGANYPKWIIKEYLLNQSIEYKSNWNSELIMLRYNKEIILKVTND
tara:strand:+ start:4405 stop:5373 length:969 start_codon:yes stop_codon:yes gene_type:complete